MWCIHCKKLHNRFVLLFTLILYKLKPENPNKLNYHSIDELIDNFIKIKDLPISCYCYSLENQLRIDYKGNLLDCHASLYDPYLEKDKLANTILD